MPPQPERPVYRLTLRALPWPTPPAVRLRAVLKRLLRTFGFVCVDAAEVPPVDRPDPTA
jgi:hypothetical protein